MRDIKLYLSVPSCREPKAGFNSSLLGLTARLLTKGIEGYNLLSVYPEIAAQASCLSQARQHAFNSAVAGHFTHWLSLDDDMMFPDTVLEQMLAHQEAIVTANYRRKNYQKVIGVCQGLDGHIIDSTGKRGSQKIGWMGGGLFLADIAKIRHIPKPHFEVVYCPERDDYYDQDNYFSAKLRQHGIEIVLDHDLSQKITHIGDYPFNWPQTLAVTERAA